MGTEKERRDTRAALLYELRRLIKNNEKQTYTKEELCDWFDTISEDQAQDAPTSRPAGLWVQRRNAGTRKKPCCMTFGSYSAPANRKTFRVRRSWNCWTDWRWRRTRTEHKSPPEDSSPGGLCTNP